MKPHELRELSDAELQKRISDEQESLANLKFQLSLSQLENTAKIKLIKRDLARMKTILRERSFLATRESKETTVVEGK
jgi:large subunit ribosomal protein L29